MENVTKMRGGFRGEAAKAFYGAAAISGLAGFLAGVAFLAGSEALLDLLATLGHVCLRAWRALPDFLRIWAVPVSAIGSATGILWLVAAARRWRRTTRFLRLLSRQSVDVPAEILPLLERHGLEDRVLVVDDIRHLALTVGLLAPRIIISTGLLQALAEDELEAVLLHEQSHLQHRDPLYLLLSRTLAGAFFFLPAGRTFCQRHEAAVELAADQYVIARQGGALSLSSALVKLLRLAPARVPANLFTGVGDLRMAHLLGRDVSLPPVSLQLSVHSWIALALVIIPVAGLYGAARVLTYLPFLTQCVV